MKTISDDPYKIKGDVTKGTLATVAVGFGTDAYDIFVVNILLVILQELYPSTDADKSLISTAVLVGAILGQLVFGQLADVLGRKRMFLVTLGFIIVFSGLSGAAQNIGGNSGIYYWLAVSRFLLGLGIGGEYPLSATVTSELSTTETRGRNMAIVFSSQGFGNLLAGAFCTILAYSNVPLEWIWRSAFLLPALICILSAYPRSKLSESHRYLQKSKGEIELTWRQKVRKFFSLMWAHKLTLLGTAGSWFLFDIMFYGNSLFNANVLSILKINKADIKQTILSTLILSAIGLPGYVFSVLFAERIGRKRIQCFGFLMVAIIFAVMAFTFETLSTNYPVIFIALYGLTFFFSNFGPNATTYSIPAEVFPVDIAATCHGISAAFGKVGAVVGASAFVPMKERWGLMVVFLSCAGISFAGLLLTLAVTKETRGIDLEEVDQKEVENESINYHPLPNGQN